jgi:hypothetical protein
MGEHGPQCQLTDRPVRISAVNVCGTDGVDSALQALPLQVPAMLQVKQFVRVHSRFDVP